MNGDNENCGKIRTLKNVSIIKKNTYCSKISEIIKTLYNVYCTQPYLPLTDLLAWDSISEFKLRTTGYHLLPLQY